MQISDLAEVVLATLSKYHKGGPLNLAQTNQHYASLDFFKRAKKYVGTDQKWFAITSDDGSFANHGPFGTWTPNSTDDGVEITAGWKQFIFGLSYDLIQMQLQASDEVKLYDIIKAKFDRSWLSFADGIEGQIWNRPVDSTNSAGHLLGIPYWVTMAGATSTMKLSDTELTGFSSGIGGLTVATAPNWANWNKTHVDMSYTDGIDGLRRFAEKSKYMAPMNVDYLKTGGTPRRAIYTGIDNKLTIENVARSQNQNIGADVAHYDGKSNFHGMPIEWVPKLDESAYNGALYCLDLGNIEYAGVKGAHMERFSNEGATNMNQPTVVSTAWVSAGQMRAHDRRSHYVSATATFGVTGRI